MSFGVRISRRTWVIGGLSAVLIPATVAGLLAVTGRIGVPGQADDTVPMTYAEAAAQLDAATPRTDANWPSHHSPPGNVRAENFQALFSDTVMISRIFYVAEPGFDEMKIIFIGADGRYVWCSANPEEGRFWHDHPWQPELRTIGGKLAPIFNPHSGETGNGGLSPLYDGATGKIVWYTLIMGRWWDWDRGHLQKRLPAVTWDLCPGFPSAEELGVEVNAAQTATTYDALIAQNPGTRILRPDLITPNAIATYNE